MSISPPIKYPGGKFYLAKLIHKLSPPHITRAVAFGGGLGEFWNWPHEGVSEVVNDSDSRLYNLWQVWQREDTFNSFCRQVSAIPVSRQHWQYASQYSPAADIPDVESAVQFFVWIRQSMMGLKEDFAPLSVNRTRRKMNEQASAWLSAIEGLPAVHERLKRVVLENLDFTEFLQKYDNENTFFYLDPTYFPGTALPLYDHMMTVKQHMEMLDFCLGAKSRILLSGYSCPEYETKLTGWSRLTVSVASAMGKSTKKQTKQEILWANFPLDTNHV
jgi:DNA adenine methylase